jgi:hypothetical protein
MTVIDNALTRPWTVDKRYVRNPNPLARNQLPTEQRADLYRDRNFPSADGMLMPAKKDQQPPDLRYFGQPKKEVMTTPRTTA